MEECNQKVWNISDQVDISTPFSAKYLLEVGVHVSLKLATKVFVRGKKTSKSWFLGCFSKAKTEECNENIWNVLDQFGINTPYWAIYLVEVGARVSLKVVTKVFLRGQETLKI